MINSTIVFNPNPIWPNPDPASRSGGATLPALKNPCQFLGAATRSDSPPPAIVLASVQLDKECRAGDGHQAGHRQTFECWAIAGEGAGPGDKGLNRIKRGSNSIGCCRAALKKATTQQGEPSMSELEFWTQQIVKGRISRREFFGRAAALGVTTALATTLLEGAGVAAEGKKGGSARFGLAHGATTDTLDPAGYPDTGTQVPFWGGMS